MGISKRTVKKLWFASGNECAHPDCDQELVDFEDDTIMGIQCHIRARRSGGPRYDDGMVESERNGYSNLLLLCPTHHRMVDESPNKYPPEILEEWKQQHEQDAGDAPELQPDVLEELLLELDPTTLLLYVEPGDLEELRDVVDWEPSIVYPGKMTRSGNYPIVVTFDGLKNLLDRVSVPYRQQMNSEPLYKHSSEWTEDELIAASSIAAHITKSAIQYFQVEGGRRKSGFLDSL